MVDIPSHVAAAAVHTAEKSHDFAILVSAGGLAVALIIAIAVIGLSGGITPGDLSSMSAYP